MPRGFYVSGALAMTAINALYNNVTGHGFRFHASLRDPKQSWRTPPYTYAGVAASVRASVEADKYRETVLAIVVDDTGLVTVAAVVHRAMFESGKWKRFGEAYDETMFHKA